MIVVLAFIASIPLMIFSAFMWFVMIFVQILLTAMFPYGLLIYALVVFLVALATVFLSSIVEMVWRPMHMLFWRKVSGQDVK